ncbi:hypothetical protein GUJ93_ZPchr0011g28455 [Zizania palustris]|uniref:Uncharacterized protein n=1 Tax=Zizania palustris TaxID=103762 RepID=A0A8J6BJX4_ZIZPA|nr:hypothetical protein GUJ93_ZPchr0011g28455 [Zizania palustris]
MSDVPGYFVGRPANQEAKPDEKEKQSSAANTQIPGDYFVGRPPNQPAEPPAPARSSFIAKCCPCLAGGPAES